MNGNRGNANLRRVVYRGKQEKASYRGRLRFLQTRSSQRGDPQHLLHHEPFGFTGHAPDGSVLVCAAPGGNQANAFVIMAYNEKYLLQVEEGEAALYNMWGDYCKLSEGIAETKASEKVIADTPRFECTYDAYVGHNLYVGNDVHAAKNVHAGEKVVSQGDQIAAGISQVHHKHPGVQTGGDLSDEPAP